LRNEHPGIQVEIVDEQGLLAVVHGVKKPAAFDVAEISAEANEIHLARISQGVLEHVGERAPCPRRFRCLGDDADIGLPGDEFCAPDAGDEGGAGFLVVEQSPDLGQTPRLQKSPPKLIRHQLTLT
jgi:hypothetical protein